LHVRVCGGRRGQPRLLPGSQRRPTPRFCREVAYGATSSARRGSVPAFGNVSRTMSAAIKIEISGPPTSEVIHRFRNFGEDIYRLLRDTCSLDIDEIDVA